MFKLWKFDVRISFIMACLFGVFGDEKVIILSEKKNVVQKSGTAFKETLWQKVNWTDKSAD